MTDSKEQAGVGPVALQQVLKDERVAVYQDPRKHLHIYYCGFYRAVMSFGFFRDAEVSLFETDDFLEIRSMGQGIMRFPMAHDLHEPVENVADEEWPDHFGSGEDYGKSTDSSSGSALRT